MQTLDMRITAELPGHPRTLWEGVFWAAANRPSSATATTPTCAPTKAVEWFIVGLARQKNYYSVYVNAADGRRYLTEAYAGRLGKVKAGKSSISFRRLADVEMEVLMELVERAGLLMGGGQAE